MIKKSVLQFLLNIVQKCIFLKLQVYAIKKWVYVLVFGPEWILPKNTLCFKYFNKVVSVLKFIQACSWSKDLFICNAFDLVPVKPTYMKKKKNAYKQFLPLNMLFFCVSTGSSSFAIIAMNMGFPPH